MPLTAGFFEIIVMVERLTELLQTLHSSGRVHRDLKPANVLYLLNSTQWRLLDLGIVANVGEQPVRCQWVLVMGADMPCACAMPIISGARSPAHGVSLAACAYVAALQSVRIRSYSDCEHTASIYAGDVLWPRCTLAYAPPEVALAVDANRDITIATEHDMWALGVMAFEAVVKRQALTTLADVQKCARGAAPYPWELPPDHQPPAWRQSRLRGVITPCVARDPRARPTAAGLLAAVERIGQTEDTQG